MPRKKLDTPTTTTTIEETTPAPEAVNPEPAPKKRRSPFKLFSDATQRVVESVTAAVSGVETPAAAKATKAKATKTTKTPAAKPAAKAVKEAEPTPSGDDLPIPVWRPRQAKAADATTEGSPKSGSRRGKRGRKETPAEEGEVAVEVTEKTRPPKREKRERVAREPKPIVVAIPEPPPVVVRPIVPTPEDAPQVVMRNGIPTLVRNHRVYPPMMFFGSSSDENKAATVIDELRMAGEAGIHLHSHLIEFEVDPSSVDASVSMAAYLLKKSIEADPECQVLFRLVFKPAKGWENEYPDSRYFVHDDTLADPSVCDDKFWGVARECLRNFVARMMLLESRNHILGLHLDRGEWFLASDWGYDTSTAAKHMFRDWARTRYFNDEVALRASWFDGGARFDQLTIPPYQPEGSDGEKFVRASRKQRRYVDYHLFLSDATVSRIGDLAYTAKEASEGNFLIGVSYGYTFEWSHPSSGHLSLGKLLRTPEIDFIAGPPSYRSREPGGASPFPGPIDSFALNGKLFISEEDFKTSIASGRDLDDFNPVIKTPQALESVHWRGIGSALAHASGACWMDLWGNGWLKTQSIWDRASKVREALTSRMGAEISDPDVVVFIDERALAYLVDPNAFQLLVQNVRESVLRSGMSAGFYLLSDLAHRERFPEAKLYLFLNAWDIRPELRAAIKTRLQRDNKVLFWLYSAGLFDSGRDSLERAREVTGIALKPQPFYSKSGTTVLNRRHPLCEAFADKGLGGATKLEPSYFAIPEDATILGEYSQTGLPSFLVKEYSGDGDPSQAWRSVFLGEPVVTPALIRALGQMAGAHVWNYQEDVVHVRPPFLTVHCAKAGSRTITLPNKFSAYNLLTKKYDATDATSLKFTAVDGSTHLFLVGVKEELDQLLALDPDTLLTMAELPTKAEDHAPLGANFDVPIMKLDEWMEGGDADEVAAEDWLLHPRLVEEPEGESEKVGRRRSRRGRRGDRGDRGGSEETAGATGTMVDEDLGMHVMFRKRE